MGREPAQGKRRPKTTNNPTERSRKRISRKLGPRGAVNVLLTSLALLSVVLLFVGIPAAVVAYGHFVAELPSPDNIGSRATFKTARILDRNGRLLYEILDPQGGRRTVVRLNDVAPAMQLATIAVEDITFYVNPGFDLRAIARAVWLNARGSQVVSGASTITQQLVKNTLLTPEVTMERKLKEAVLAWEVSRRYSKDQILEMYLNEVYYGNMAYGVEAAAQTYFGKPATLLNLAEAGLLAGLVQSPAEFDPFTDLPSAKERQAVVLDLMAKYELVTPEEAEAAKMAKLTLRRRADAIAVPLKAPHFAMYIRDIAEKRFGRDQLYYGGLEIRTTLDLDMQEKAEQAVTEHLARINRLNVNDAALVAIEPASGEVMAMVGSADFFDEKIGGQVNVATSRRQPGSTLKPFVYLTGLAKGFTPASILQDVPSDFSGYQPKNHDKKFRGPVRLREALANSLNVPAVRMLQAVGVEEALATMHRLGITDLPDERRYGLALALGAGEVKLLDLTFSYAALANGGVQVGEPVAAGDPRNGLRQREPVSILKVVDSSGRVLYEHQPAEGKQVADPQLTYLITSILSDDAARSGTYGRHSFLELSRPAAAKTGTTDDFRDGWTLGYTPDLATGVWVGNADNTPMLDVYGVSGAGHIWHNFMEKALHDLPPRGFVRPAGIREETICADTGQTATPACTRPIKEVFAGNAAALIGSRQQPGRIAISSPASGSTVSGIVDVIGTAFVGAATSFALDFAAAANPEKWLPITPYRALSVQNNLLGRWNTSDLPPGDYMLRLTVKGNGATSETTATAVTVSGQRPATATTTPTATRTPGPPSPTPTVQRSTPTAVPTTATPKPTTRAAVTPTATIRPAARTATPTPRVVKR